MYSSLHGIRQHFKTELDGQYSAREIEQLFYRLVESFGGLSKTEAVLAMRDEVDTILADEMTQAVVRLKQNEPVQYVDNSAWFMGDKYYVDNSVLIPRPETEELVHWILNDYDNKRRKVLDIGTGSGIIPISLAKHRPAWEVMACDISNDALFVARKNAGVLLNGKSIGFYKEDILHPQTDYGKQLDVIVSNPPYVLDSDKSEMQEAVLQHEPHLALFVPDNDPLLFYKAITQFANNNLTTGGRVYFEVHETYANEVVELLVVNGFDNVKAKKDLQDKLRMVSGGCTK